MQLSHYLRTLDKDAREAFAKKVSKAGSVGYLYLIAGGHRRASAELALRIEAESGSAVTRAEIRPDLWVGEVQA